MIGERTIQSETDGAFLQFRPAETHQGDRGLDRQLRLARGLGLLPQTHQGFRRIVAQGVEPAGESLALQPRRTFRPPRPRSSPAMATRHRRYAADGLLTFSPAT